MTRDSKPEFNPDDDSLWLGKAIGVLPIIAGMLWFTVPPRDITMHRGEVVSWTAAQDRTIAISYYKMKLQVKLDDGREVVAYSERKIAPTVATQLSVQERHGWIGPSSFVEIPRR